jgi:colicin import membrane protein
MSLASDRPEFTPPSSSGRGRAIGLAVLAHAFLIAALTWGVGWKRESTNAPVQAELWSTTVQQAAPALVEPTPPPQVEPKPEPKVEPLPPPPAPPPKPVKVVEPEPEPKIDPQIAIEKAKKEEKKKLEKKKADEAKEKAKALAKKEAEEAAEEAKLAALDKKKRALEAKKLEAKKAAEAKAAENDKKYEASLKAAREANLKRIAGIAGASGGETATGTAKQSTGPSAGYEGRIMARIKPNWVFTREISGNLVCIVEVTTSADGKIIRTRVSESSGNPAWDEASLRAMEKTEIIPKDLDGRLHSPYLIKFDSRKML